MRKIILLVLLNLINNLYFCQTASVGVSTPTPTISSLSTYRNTPVSIQTGIPNVSYDLFEVPSNNKYVNINLSLNYHAGNVTKDYWTGDLGSGWSLLGQGVISRELFDEPDERYSDTGDHHYHKNRFDDVYNYSIPGESGKFKVERDFSANTFEIVKLTPSTSQIEYTRTNNTATLIFDTFTIKNDKGIKYKFNIYNVSNKPSVAMWSPPNDGVAFATDFKYRSAFMLTSIQDENDVELVHFTYKKVIKYHVLDNQMESITYKIEKIEIKDRGIIEIEYDEDPTVNKRHDKFSIKEIRLNNNANRLISKYKFEYDFQGEHDYQYWFGPYAEVPYPYIRRQLKSLRKIDRLENEIEKTEYNYQTHGYLVHWSGPESIFNYTYNEYATLLHRVKLPSKGVTEYNFDFVPLYESHGSVNVPNKIAIGNVSFGSINNMEKKYFFTLTSDKQVVIDIYAAQLANHQWSLNFYKKVGNTFQLATPAIGPLLEADPNYPESQTIPVDAGEYYVSLNTNEVGVSFNGTIEFEAYYIDGYTTQPTPEKYGSEKGLPRIKNIKYFNQELSTVNNFSIPSRIEEYDYSKFDNPSSSSSYLVENGSLDGITPYNPTVIYKNVKVSNGGNGYVKYYFKAPNDFGFEQTEIMYVPIWKNYNLSSQGILDRKETYNAANKKVTEDHYHYEFEDSDNPKFLVAPSNVSTNFHVKTAWVKKQTVHSKNIFDSGELLSVKEVTKNDNQYVSIDRTISHDGSVQETNYYYPHDKGIQKLIDANITAVPLEVVVKGKSDTLSVEKNLSKELTLYNHSGNIYPSSSKTLDITDNSTQSEVLYEKYDERGNLVQYTVINKPTMCVIWGYNKTLPIAKIEGASYDAIKNNALITAIVTASDQDALQVIGNNEALLLTALDDLRNHVDFKNYLITTYTYDPLVGMRSSTTPSGFREYYIYDTANRLERITDKEGNILKEYKYKYRPQ